MYNVGADGELRNLEVVKLILDHLGKSHDLIQYVPDRLGHDRRYAIDSAKAHDKLRWKPLHRPEEGIRATVDWYVRNEGWWAPLLEAPHA